MELYLDLHSQPCRSVYLFAKLAGIPFEFKHVDLSAGKSGPPRRLEIRLHTWLIRVCLWAFSSASGYSKPNETTAVFMVHLLSRTFPELIFVLL